MYKIQISTFFRLKINAGAAEPFLDRVGRLTLIKNVQTKFWGLDLLPM